MTALLLPGAEGPPALEGEMEAVPARQKNAATGKELPDEAAAEEDGDAKDKAADVPFAWFGAAPTYDAPPAGGPSLPARPVPLPQSGALIPGIRLPATTLAHAGPEPALPVAEDIASAVVAPPETQATPVAASQAPSLPLAGSPHLPVEDRLEPAPLPAAAPVAAPIAQPFASHPAPRAVAPDAQVSRIAPATTIGATPQASRTDGGVASASPQPIVAPLQPPSIPPPPVAELPAPRRAVPREPVSTVAPLSPGEAPRPVSITAPAETQHAPLDLRHHEWTGAMLDRIEAMRDAVGARETNIRLAPDALGSVDISIRQEGGRVHVHFAAETAAARAALNDAQPRLAELAEARGLRLGQTTIGAGGGSGADTGLAGQSGERQQPTPSSTPSAPASARTESESTDDRIA